MTPEERSELEQKYLLGLLTRDAVIWRRHAARSRHQHFEADENGSWQRSPRPKRSPTFLSEAACSKCGSHRKFSASGWKCVKCAEEKARRVDKIKTEALARVAPPPRGRGLGIRPSQLLSDRAVARRNYLASLARGAETANPPAPPVESHQNGPVSQSARAAAMAAGAKRYVGEPCGKCGNRVRYTAHRGCVECPKIAKRKHRAAIAPAAPPAVMAEPRRLRPSQLIRPSAPAPMTTKALKFAPHEKPRRWASK
jgi:hypothetical protein